MECLRLPSSSTAKSVASLRPDDLRCFLYSFDKTTLQTTTAFLSITDHATNVNALVSEVLGIMSDLVSGLHPTTHHQTRSAQPLHMYYNLAIVYQQAPVPCKLSKLLNPVFSPGATFLTLPMQDLELASSTAVVGPTNAIMTEPRYRPSGPQKPQNKRTRRSRQTGRSARSSPGPSTSRKSSRRSTPRNNEAFLPVMGAIFGYVIITATAIVIADL